MTDRKNSTSQRTAAFTAVPFFMVMISIVAGMLYPFIEGRIGPLGNIAAKGICVTALAIAAPAVNQRWLAAIMAAGALGDILLELPGGLIAGGVSFAAGHAIATVYYTRNRRPALQTGDSMRAAALVGYGLAMPWLVMPAGAALGQMTLYSFLLCTMAAAAWISRFPRQWTALGALLFVVSDTLLIMRLGGRIVGGPALHGALVWYFYYFGQLGIFIGVSGWRVMQPGVAR
jgi:uncharacterized membrane protein YhhN